MKKILFFILLFNISSIVSAQKDFSSQTISDSAIVTDTTQNLEDLKSQVLEMKKYATDKCKIDSLRAVEEAKYNLSYSLALANPLLDNYLFLAEKEFIQVLRENKIGYGGYMIGNYFGIPDNCFQLEMNRIVEKHFGKDFIENLQRSAVKKFIKNNPDRIFEFEECDLESRYFAAKTYHEMFKKIESDYFKNFKYPTKFVNRDLNNGYSDVEVNFILDKNGKVSQIRVELSLKEKKNYIYSSYLINSVKEFINKSKWKPASYQGIPVISKMNVLIFYK